MKPKELTPEEIIEELCGEKEYYQYGDGKNFLKERLETRQISAWTREHHRDRHRSITVELKVPKKCTKIPPAKNQDKCPECKRKRAHDFQWRFNTTPLNHCYLVFFFDESLVKINGLYKKIGDHVEEKYGKEYGMYAGENSAGKGAIWVNIPGGGEASFAILEPDGFSISVEKGEYFPKCFPKTKELAIDLLKLYLEAHKDCCTW